MAQKLPGSFDVKIMQRYMNEKSLQEFLETYRANCHKIRAGITEPTAIDIRIVGVLRRTQSYQITAKELGITPFRVMTAAGRVGTYGR